MHVNLKVIDRSKSRKSILLHSNKNEKNSFLPSEFLLQITAFSLCTLVVE